jgi:glycosyltransferase involved in cell wall biosynthesis
MFQFQAFFEGIKIKADVVEGSNFITYLPSFVIAKKLNVPCIAWYPDVFIGKWLNIFGPFLGLFGEILERLVLKLPWDGVIAISQSTKEKLIKSGFKRKITVIPCGVDLKEFSKSEKFKKPTVIAVSRLEKYKRIDLLKNIRNVNIIIVGTGPEEENLKKIIPNAIFKKNLPRKELISLLEKSHILCHPSTEEGFGIVLIEALAANTPYIASNIPAIKEITENGQGGILTEDISSAIISLVKNKKLYNSKQKEGEKLINKYNWKNIGRDTYEYYRNITNI